MKKVSMFVCCVLGSMGLATANISYANMTNNTSGTSIHPRTSNSSDNTKNNEDEKAPVIDKHIPDQSQNQGKGQSLTQ